MDIFNRIEIMDIKKLFRYLSYDLIGSLLLAVSIDIFAVHAKFAPGGVNGLAVIANYLTNVPIGLATLIINVPIILFTYKKLGMHFFLISLKTMLLNVLFIDYILVYFPIYEGPRLIASILSAIFAGIGYSLIFNEGSSTGGTDFIIVAIKQKNDQLSFGLLTFVVDGLIILLSIFVFKDIWSFVYGCIYTVVVSMMIDITTKIITVKI